LICVIITTSRITRYWTTWNTKWISRNRGMIVISIIITITIISWLTIERLICITIRVIWERRLKNIITTSLIYSLIISKWIIIIVGFLWRWWFCRITKWTTKWIIVIIGFLWRWWFYRIVKWSTKWIIIIMSFPWRSRSSRITKWSTKWIRINILISIIIITIICTNLNFLIKWIGKILFLYYINIKKL